MKKTNLPAVPMTCLTWWALCGFLATLLSRGRREGVRSLETVSAVEGIVLSPKWRSLTY